MITGLIALLFLACNSNTVKKKNERFAEQPLPLFNGSEPKVRVRIIYTLDSLSLKFFDSWQAYQRFNTEKITFNDLDRAGIRIAENKMRLYQGSSNNYAEFDSLELVAKESGGEIQIANVPYGIGWWWAGEEDRNYEGKINIYPGQDGNLEVIVTLALEDYLCGVIPYEIGGDAPIEALKAQAVAARSEAIVALTSNLYSGKHYDLTSDVECQVFGGNNKRSEVSDLAVAETRGLILSENGQPVNAYYASNCGGHSELIKNVWPTRTSAETYKITHQDIEGQQNLNLSEEYAVRTWIQSSPEVYCNPNLKLQLPGWSQKNFRWQRIFAVDSLSKMISAGKALGELQNIKVLKRGVSGRAYLVNFVFKKDSIEVKGELAIRQMWHPPLRSSCFIVDKQDNSFVIRGAGWGHGVGMCQSGAVAQALQGKGFLQILRHYYLKADLSFIY